MINSIKTFHKRHLMMKNLGILAPGGQLQGVDIWKYIMALGVVAIHVATGSCTGIAFPKLFSWFIRLAVPYFFIASGFLLSRELSARPIGQHSPFLRLRCKKILKLFLCWVMIYIPITLISFIFIQRKSLEEIMVYIITNILVYGEILYAWPLWFLYSMLLTTLGLWATSRSRAARAFLIIFICLFYLTDQIFNHIGINNLPHYIQSLHKVLPFRAIAGGAYLLCGSMVYITYKHLANNLIIFTLLASSLTLYLLKLPCFEMIGGIAIFILATFFHFNNSRLSRLIRIQSMWIYYLHMYVIFSIVMAAKMIHVKLELWPTYIIVLTTIVIISYFLSQLQTRRDIKILNFLTK